MSDGFTVARAFGLHVCPCEVEVERRLAFSRGESGVVVLSTSDLLGALWTGAEFHGQGQAPRLDVRRSEVVMQGAAFTRARCQFGRNIEVGLCSVSVLILRRQLRGREVQHAGRFRRGAVLSPGICGLHRFQGYASDTLRPVAGAHAAENHGGRHGSEPAERGVFKSGSSVLSAASGCRSEVVVAERARRTDGDDARFRQRSQRRAAGVRIPGDRVYVQFGQKVAEGVSGQAVT